MSVNHAMGNLCTLPLVDAESEKCSFWEEFVVGKAERRPAGRSVEARGPGRGNAGKDPASRDFGRGRSL